MLVAVEIAPHERRDAIEAYSHHLSPEQATEIMDAPEDLWVRLEMGGGPTRVTIVQKQDEYWLDSVKLDSKD